MWGATTESLLPDGDIIIYFNPRTHVGCDIEKQSPQGDSLKISIHAPMWGATIEDNDNRDLLENFNPRTHVGCDTRSAEVCS